MKKTRCFQNFLLVFISFMSLKIQASSFNPEELIPPSTPPSPRHRHSPSLGSIEDQLSPIPALNSHEHPTSYIDERRLRKHLTHTLERFEDTLTSLEDALKKTSEEEEMKKIKSKIQNLHALIRDTTTKIEILTAPVVRRAFSCSDINTLQKKDAS